MLYARVKQADGLSWRNLALTRAQLVPSISIVNQDLPPEIDAAVLFGDGEIKIDKVHDLLHSVGLSEDAPLTTLAVEVFGNSPVRNPVSRCGDSRSA